MRKMFLFVFFISIATVVFGQSIRDEIQQDIRRSAGKYMTYPIPGQDKKTPNPEGKPPFYISHYGQGGARYLSQKEDYETPYRILEAADLDGKLTPLGHDVLQRVSRIRDDAYQRWGELTESGARQQQQIISRMVKRFPEVFADGAAVDARSVMTTLSILSMENAMMELSALRPKLKLHHNATERDMRYLDYQDKQLTAIRMDTATRQHYDRFAVRHTNDKRLMQALFNDTAYVRQHVDMNHFGDCLFKIASNLQSTELRKQMTLYDLFDDEEVYNHWEKDNAWWYVNYGGCTVNGGLQPYTQRHLLRKIIEQADSCIRLPKPGIHLRFGHETALMSLVCLLNLNGYGLATDNLETLDRKGWADYKISPMSANVQLVFFRTDPEDDNVLVKVLLNENEVKLPVKTWSETYYQWSAVRDYWLKQLDVYETKLKGMKL